MDRRSKLKKKGKASKGGKVAKPKPLSSSSGSTEVNEKPDVFMPGDPMEEDEELVYDPTAYHMLHAATTSSPCLSFDVIPDELGDNRTTYPHTAYIVAGTQADRPNGNSIIVMKASNMLKTLKEDKSDSESEEDSDDEDEEAIKAKLARMETALIRHHGCVNRIRCKAVGETILAAAWSEMGKVSIVDLKPQLQFLDDPIAYPELKKFKQSVGAPIQPLFVFNGHQVEGFAVDWSPTLSGVLATGDSRKNIHVWSPAEGGSWHVDQVPLIGHTSSVEDLQWSPNEPHVLASCSVDKSIRIWDTRESGTKSCKLVLENAHTSDVNVISWNKKEPLIVSGGDDGFLYVWDLRQFKTGQAVATLKHHNDQVSTVEWSPHDSSVFASGGGDDQIALWDLAVEKDSDAADADGETETKELPPQLLFIHQGQTELKELHWHPQIPGMVVSTANTGFNFFKTISV